MAGTCLPVDGRPLRDGLCDAACGHAREHDVGHGHGVCGTAFFSGLLYFLASPARPPRWQLVLRVLAPLTIPLLSLLGVALHRPWLFLPYIFDFLIVVKAALNAARREHGANHLWLVGGTLVVPAYLAITAVLGIDPYYVRYYFLMPAILIGLLLLTVSLMRRRRALETENARRLEAERALTALNATLENKVADRSADLQNIVAGSESFNRTVSHDLRGSLGAAGLRVSRDSLTTLCKMQTQRSHAVFCQ